MAKHVRKVKANKNEVSIEEGIDDHLLPSAEELSKYKELYPDIIPWIMKRAEEEQKHRHEVNRERIKITKSELRGNRWINYLGLFFAFILLSGGMVFAYWLINEGHEVMGSLFSGGILIPIIAMFLSKVRSNNREKTPRK